MKYRLQQIYNTGEQRSFNWSNEDMELSDYFGGFLTNAGLFMMIIKRTNKLKDKEREAFIENLHRLINGQGIYILNKKFKMDLEKLEIIEAKKE